MLIEECNTHVIQSILSYLSPLDILAFSRACPKHQEAVDETWKKHKVINLDDVLVRDLADFIQIFQYCLRVQEVRCRRKRYEEIYNDIVGSIVRNNRSLEVLDIPGLLLTTKDRWLEYCVNLRSLNIKFDNKLDSNEPSRILMTIYERNPQLENLCIKCPIMSKAAFINLPNTIRKLKLMRRKGLRPVPMDNWVFNNIANLEFEKLCLPKEILSVNHVTSLHRQTRLRSLNIRLSNNFDNTEALNEIFRNNRDLEDVSIRGQGILPTLNYSLTQLPITVKRLTLEPMQRDDWDEFLNTVGTWTNLASLNLGWNMGKLRNRFLELVVVAPQLQHLTIDWGIDLSYLYSLKTLEHLKTLWIKGLDQSIVEYEEIGGFACLEKVILTDIVYIGGNEFSDWLVALPQLKEFVLNDELNFCISYTQFIQRISKCPGLTTARFKKCFHFRNKDALILIRNCHSLKELEIIESHCITDDLVNKTETELEMQKERTHILHLTITLQTIKSMFTETTHRLLDLQILPEKKPCSKIR